jgi:hypothetical protein
MRILHQRTVRTLPDEGSPVPRLANLLSMRVDPFDGFRLQEFLQQKDLLPRTITMVHCAKTQV